MKMFLSKEILQQQRLSKWLKLVVKMLMNEEKTTNFFCILPDRIQIKPTHLSKQ
jgi:hypothetical protein